MQSKEQGFFLKAGLIGFVLVVLLSVFVRHEAEQLGANVKADIQEAISSKVESLFEFPGDTGSSDIESIQWK